MYHRKVDFQFLSGWWKQSTFLCPIKVPPSGLRLPCPLFFCFCVQNPERIVTRTPPANGRKQQLQWALSGPGPCACMAQRRAAQLLHGAPAAAALPSRPRCSMIVIYRGAEKLSLSRHLQFVEHRLTSAKRTVLTQKMC